MTRVWQLAFGSVMVFFLALPAQADYLIQLKSGATYEVPAYREEGGEVRIYLGGGEVGIPRSDILRITPLKGAQEARDVMGTSFVPPIYTEPSAPSEQEPAPKPEAARAEEQEESPKAKEPPRVVEVSPKSGEPMLVQMFQYPVPLSVTFSKPMDQKSVEAAIVMTPPQEGSFSWSGNTVTFTPATWDLTNGVTITIGTGAKDLEGTPLAAPHQMAFSRTLPAPHATSP